ncbi:MAG: arsenic efflux protein [Clostridia bacterium]|nr:arsenic efflux protein [Clostridia bacterium]
MTEFLEILHHAFEDTYPLFLWIFLIYIVIELLESKTDLAKSERFRGQLGPLVGAATGLIPQCGFSVMASKLYEKKYITVGTLLAIFLSTSDEAFVILLTSGNSLALLKLLAVKLIVGVLFGYLIDWTLKLAGRGQVCVEPYQKPEKTPSTVHEIFMQAYLEEKEVSSVCSCGKEHEKGRNFKNYFLSPLLHALQVIFFIFLVNFVLTAIIHGNGEQALERFMKQSRFVQPLITCAIGLIPNCASSVVITETYLSGGIAFGSCVAGLCANAGMGFVILLKNTKAWKRNLALIGLTYGISVFVGIVCNLFAFL